MYDYFLFIKGYENPSYVYICLWPNVEDYMERISLGWAWKMDGGSSIWLMEFVCSIEIDGDPSCVYRFVAEFMELCGEVCCLVRLGNGYWK